MQTWRQSGERSTRWHHQWGWCADRIAIGPVWRRRIRCIRTRTTNFRCDQSIDSTSSCGCYTTFGCQHRQVNHFMLFFSSRLRDATQKNAWKFNLIFFFGFRWSTSSCCRRGGRTVYRFDGTFKGIYEIRWRNQPWCLGQILSVCMNVLLQQRFSQICDATTTKTEHLTKCHQSYVFFFFFNCCHAYLINWWSYPKDHFIFCFNKKKFHNKNHHSTTEMKMHSSVFGFLFIWAE